MALHRHISRLGRSTLGLFFPRVCLACQAPLPDPAEEFCTACRQELAVFRGECCQRCGAPQTLPGAHGNRCVHCEKLPLNFDVGIAIGSYEGLLRKLVLEAKEVTGETTAAVLGRMLASTVAERMDAQSIDLVTCVPMPWRRRLVRRHNAPEVIGEVLARQLAAPFRPRLVRTTRAPHKQSELAASERRRNVRGAFRVRADNRLRGATVALVDDILTTGATCSEAAKELKAVGAARVVAVVAARSL
ncbi:MAG: ComF family protein [Planctomycetales bacterium]|nr:ComF family protein [Planctomycetales bacterium]